MAVDQVLWRRAEDVFHAALARPPEERQAFLDEACRADPDLRRFVETLLREDERHPSFLGQPAALLASTDAPKSGSQRPASGREPDLEFGSPEPGVARGFGTYRILALLGAGGMGEVYRAHDERLGRDVAIKRLPPAFSEDAGRLARFRREARVLASLNHPNIGSIYALEGTPEGDYLVLELVEGDRLRGPLPVAAAVELASQVAEALEAAHQHGIVHRDLKPSNVKVTPEGRVKVLDFGLAKAIASAEEAATPAPGRLPVRPAETTATGNILGTPGYMSPEQARGEAVDERTDIWAFGCLIYELLTGRRAFELLSGVDYATAVLEHEPDWTHLPEDTPAKLRDLLESCLQKDVNARTRSISDARHVLSSLQLLRDPQAGAKSHARGLDAYELCLRARYHHQQRTPEGFATALRLFQEALERDPDCALAHAGIAHVCLIASYFGSMPISVGMPKMKACARRAVELDEQLAVAHVRLADAFCFADWDWLNAEREFQRALVLDPYSPEALCRYGLFLWARQRNEESLVHFLRSLDVDPFSLDTNWMIGSTYISLGRLQEAEETARRMIAMAPHVWLGYHVAAGVLSKQGLWAQCADVVEKGMSLERGPAGVSWACWSFARAGRSEDASRLKDRLEQLARERQVPSTWLAIAYDAVGDEDQARTYMERAIRERHMLLVHLRGWMAHNGMLARFRGLLDQHDL